MPSSIWKPLSAFIVPSLIEETIWRGLLLPSPIVSSSLSTSTSTVVLWSTACIVLTIHVLSHPIMATLMTTTFGSVRGQRVFVDSRFLVLTTIVLGGSTISYIVSGGSVWCATFTHGVAVIME